MSRDKFKSLSRIEDSKREELRRSFALHQLRKNRLRLSQSTNMQYSLVGPNGCVESLCGRLRSAKRLCAEQKAKAPSMYFEVYRYDRSGISNYEEVVFAM